MLNDAKRLMFRAFLILLSTGLFYCAHQPPKPDSTQKGQTPYTEAARVDPTPTPEIADMSVVTEVTPQPVGGTEGTDEHTVAQTNPPQDEIADVSAKPTPDRTGAAIERVPPRSKPAGRQKPGKAPEDVPSTAPSPTPTPIPSPTPDAESKIIEKADAESASQVDNADDPSAESGIRTMTFPPPPPEYDPYKDANEIATRDDANQLISLNFNNEPIGSVLKSLFADTLKLNYILDKAVTGNITIVTTTPFPRKNLFDVILLVLKLNALTVTKAGDYYLIVPTGDVLKYMLPTQTGTKAEDLKPSERFISQVIPLKYLTPADISPIITQLKSNETQLITLDAANILIFTGPASNIRRMMEMIEVLDIETSQEEFKVFQIRFADANDILSTLQNLFSRKVSGKSMPGATPQRQPRQPQQQGRPQEAGAAGGIISVGGAAGEPVMIVDSRSNTLIVFGTRKDMEFIQKIIDLLDVDIYTYQEIFIYYVENAKAKDLKAILDELYKGTQQSKTKSGVPPGVIQQQQQQQQQQPALEVDRPGQIVGELSISVDERTNALIIQTTYRNYKILENMIQKLDLIPKQVLIEVLVAEVTLDDTMELGLQWSLKSSGKVGDSSFSSTTVTDFGVDDTTGLKWTIFEASRFQSFLKTFATDNRIEVLSNPHIMCSNNTEAKIQVGNEVPTITSSTTNTASTTTVGANITSTVEYRSTGILLTVNARVNERRMVSLDLSQEVSEAQINDLGGTNSPIIRKRILNSSLVVRDNQTIVMGGLMQKKKDMAHQGVPFLSKIPVLRWLFGTESRTSSKTELIIFITPHVIGSPLENYEKTNEFMEKIPRADRLRNSINPD